MKVYSVNGEEFNYYDIESMFDDMASVGQFVIGQEYYEADAVDIKHEDYIDGYGILEQLDERVYDDVGEYYNSDFASVSKVAKEELELLILDWARRNITLNYWKIKDKSVKKFITEDNLL